MATSDNNSTTQDLIEEVGNSTKANSQQRAGMAPLAIPSRPPVITRATKEGVLNKAHSPQITLQERIAKLRMDPSKLIASSLKSKEAIIKAKQSSLLAFVLGEPIEFTRLGAKLKFDWANRAPRFDIVSQQNFWFELRFDNLITKRKVWEGRPYHIHGNLLVLREWSPNFDPTTEEKKKVDLWFRLPKVSPVFCNKQALLAIVEANDLGKFLKFEERCKRICVDVDYELTRKEIAAVPTWNCKLIESPIWYEDNPHGCGLCGERDHEFEECPHYEENANERKVVRKYGGTQRRDHNQSMEQPSVNDDTTKASHHNHPNRSRRTYRNILIGVNHPEVSQGGMMESHQIENSMGESIDPKQVHQLGIPNDSEQPNQAMPITNEKMENMDYAQAVEEAETIESTEASQGEKVDGKRKRRDDEEPDLTSKEPKKNKNEE